LNIIEQEKDQKDARYYQYDQLNRLIKTCGHDGDAKDYSYDHRGNLTEIRSGGKTFNTYAFDAANKLTKVINKFGDKTDYTYDGFGNRIQTIIDLNQGSEKHNRPIFPPGPGGPPAFVEELKNKNPGPPSHAGNPKPGWDHQFKRDYMIQHYVMDYTRPYDNLLMSYGEHSQIQRCTYGRELISMDFIAINDHDNGWIPRGTETAYVEQWDSLYYLHDEMGTVDKVIGTSGKTSAHYNYDEFGRPLGAVKLDPNWPGPDNAVSYTGYTYDHFAELYYAQARYYLPEVGRFITEDTYRGQINNPLSLNLFTYCHNDPVNFFDPDGHAEYSVGNPTAPYQEFDEDFIYDPNAKDTWEDRASWIKWGVMLTGAKIFKDMPDATAAYEHYRSGTGTDMWIDYDKAIREDSLIRSNVIDVITEAQTSAKNLRTSGVGDSFDITGTLYEIQNGTSENWQKTIGAHYAWASAGVTYNGGKYTMIITIHVKDKYNFNRGMKDIASNTPDDVNGRFEELGWAKSFFTTGQALRVVTWNEGDICNSTEIVYSQEGNSGR